MCKWVGPIGDCLLGPGASDSGGAADKGMCKFFDPIVDGMLTPVKPVADIIAAIKDPELVLEVPDMVASLAADLPGWIENPISMVPELPFPLDTSLLPPDIDPEIATALVTAQMEVALGLLMMPLDMVMGMLEKLESLQMPTLPGPDDFTVAISGIFPNLPSDKIACLTEIPMIPVNTIADAIG
jgi:hypothetical protein